MASNFNNSTPAAPAGAQNVNFQTDGAGNDSAYVPLSATVLPGINTLALTANVSAATVLAVVTSGMYRISGYAAVTTVDTISSTLPKITITWTDADNSTVHTKDITATQAGNALTTFDSGSVYVSAQAASNIQYATSGYASGVPTIMQYSLHLSVEKVF